MLGISKGFLKQWVAPLVVAVVASFSILMAAQDQGTPFVEGQNGVFSGPSANPGPVASTAYIDASPIYNNPNQGKSDICLTINWILTSTGSGGFNYTSNYPKGAVIDARGYSQPRRETDRNLCLNVLRAAASIPSVNCRITFHN
jgi:hypothetical protein